MKEPIITYGFDREMIIKETTWKRIRLLVFKQKGRLPAETYFKKLTIILESIT